MKKGLILTTLVLLVGGYFAYQHPDVKAFLQRKSSELAPKGLNETRFYKWQDKQGEWHVTDKPPAEGIAFEELNYRHDANVMPKKAFTGEEDK